MTNVSHQFLPDSLGRFQRLLMSAQSQIAGNEPTDADLNADDTISISSDFSTQRWTSSMERTVASPTYTSLSKPKIPKNEILGKAKMR